MVYNSAMHDFTSFKFFKIARLSFAHGIIQWARMYSAQVQVCKETNSLAQTLLGTHLAKNTSQVLSFRVTHKPVFP